MAVQNRWRVVTANTARKPIDRYLRDQAGQDTRRRVAAPFVATGDGVRVPGFHALSATSTRLTEVPPALAKQLPRYPRLPGTPIRFVGRMDDLAQVASA